MSINSKLNTRIIASLISIIICTFLLLNVAYGQEELGWTQPLNLSQSGSTSKPVLAKDSSGLLYAFWQNSIDGFVVSTNQSGGWSDPKVVEVPFGTKVYEVSSTQSSPIPLYDPILFGDEEQGLHSFWVTDDLQLYHSQFITGEVSILSSWTNRSQIAGNAGALDAVADVSDVLHVAYVSFGDGGLLSPGIYHRSSGDDGVTWSDTTLIYSSSYFRQLPDGKIQLDLISSDSGSLLLAWNDLFTEQVFLAEYASGVWGSPQVIDSRQEGDRPDSTGPTNINIAVDNGLWHLFWTAGHGDANCALYTSRSTDNGQDWLFPEIVIEETRGCPEYYDVLQEEGLLVLFTKTSSNAATQIWRDGKWSLPTTQPLLLSFSDPITFRTVASNCPYQFAFYQSHLHAVGCGINNIAEDIWATARPIRELETSTPDQEVWSDPLTFAIDNSIILSPKMLTDNAGGLHAIWIQNGQGYEKNIEFVQAGKEIVYSRGDGGKWGAANQIFSSAESISNPSFSFSPVSENLLIAWEDSANQQILFSQASTSNAFNASDWSEPVVLPTLFANSSEPSLEVDQNGVLHVIYIVPFNDNRDVYVINSEDNGLSWSEPQAVLKETVKAFDIIHNLQTEISNDGILHITFVNQLTSLESASNELYYVRSSKSLLEDSIDWLSPKLIQNRLLQANTIFSHDISLNHKGDLHLVWQEWNETQVNLWGMTSNDGGLTWNEGDQISGFGTLVGNLDLSIDQQNVLHLNQLFLKPEDGRDTLTLEHWLFDGSDWLLQQPTIFPELNFYPRNTVLAAGVGSDNLLNILFSGVYSNNGRLTQGFHSASRIIETGDTGIINNESPSDEEAQTDLASSDSVDVVNENGAATSEDNNSEISITPEPKLIVVDGEVFTPIESFAASGSFIVGLTLALIVFALLLVIAGGYFAVKFIANR